jgi:hypothetical protein
VHSFFVRLLFGLGVALGPVALGAAETPPKAKETPPTAPAAEAKAAAPAAAAVTPAPASDVLELPKIQVTARRMKELDSEIKKLDKAIVREKKRVKPSELDKALNNQKVVEAAAIFGGNSSEHLQAVAATRIRYMEAERDLLSDMKVPRTLSDFQAIEKELDQVRTMQRELDMADKH